MTKYTETQTRKVLSSYGGVESILETPKGALKIEPFDLWPFFKAISEGKLQVEDYFIEDNRLLRRLQTLKGFPELISFLAIPPAFTNPNNKTIPAKPEQAISSTYFPTWFYCNNCQRFGNLNGWWKSWKRINQKHGISVQKSDFIPPKCSMCFDKAKIENKKTGIRKRFYYDLEQVRFIMTAPSGDIRDIPWNRWNKADKNSPTENGGKGVRLDYDNLCCTDPDLRYVKSTKFSDLSGIRIECKSCGSKNTLTGQFNLRIRVEKEKEVYFKPVLRTSNSCYYPLLVQSIYLPTIKDFDLEEERRIRSYHEKGKDIDFIWEALEEKYSKDKIRNFIQSESERKFEPEIEYRRKECEFIKNEKSDNKNLIFERIPISSLQQFGFDQLNAIKRLKVTTVQIAYTRQEPLDNDQFLKGETEQSKIKAKYTSSWGKQTKYLPAIESFGEGIFLSLDSEFLNSWLSFSFENRRFNDRISTLLANAKSNERDSIRLKFNSEKQLARFVLIHSLSHILIKEFEFLCGYPAISLSERLFVDENSMEGLLIYTVAGAEGSYGGLVSQANEKSFCNILKSALYRALDCASDPICYNTEDGQGVGGLNMCACYSCCLIPETACEEFNCFLDRSLLVDKEYGFFQKLLYSK